MKLLAVLFLLGEWLSAVAACVFVIPAVPLLVAITVWDWCAYRRVCLKEDAAADEGR